MTYGKRSVRAGHPDNYIEPELAEWVANRYVEQDEWREFSEEMGDFIDKLSQYKELRRQESDLYSQGVTKKVKVKKKGKKDRYRGW
jgi:hypothetical protein